MLRNGDCDCCVCCVWIREPSYIQRTLLQALGSKWQSNRDQQLTYIVGEDWSERLRYRSSQLCLHDLSKLIQSGERFEQLHKWFIQKLEAISCTFSCPVCPGLTRLVLSIGQTSGNSPAQLPASLN